MKAFLVSIFLILFTSFGFAQSITIDSCGLDNSPTLTAYEINYFEEALLARGNKNIPDLEEKRILFLNGNYGSSTYSKSDFFSRYGKPRFENSENRYPHMQLIILTEEEKLQVKNYDLIIVTWSKIPVEGKPRKKFIENALKATETL